MTGSGKSGSMRRRPGRVALSWSDFAGCRFPPGVIMVAVRWYLRYGLSYRDVEELLAERGIEVDHVTVFRWVQRFTPLLIDAARPCRHAQGALLHEDEGRPRHTPSVKEGPSGTLEVRHKPGIRGPAA